MNFSKKLESLRKKMDERGLDAYIIYSADPHKSVAVSDHWRSVRWFSGFSGWVGTIAVTAEEAAFWTDGRYVLQAKRELQGKIEQQYCSIVPEHPTLDQWIRERIGWRAKVGFDGKVVMVNEYRALQEALKLKRAELVTQWDLVGEMWENRDPIPTAPVFELSIKYTGKGRKEKLEEIRKKMRQLGAEYYLTSGLDDVAWITNLRGADSKQYPIFHSYFLITPETAFLFTEENKVPYLLQERLREDGIQWKSSRELHVALKEIQRDQVLYFDPWKTSISHIDCLDPDILLLEGLDLITASKAVKNETELANLELANIKEGVCVVRLIRRIKQSVGKYSVWEHEISGMLNEERKKMEGFLCPANIPIVGCKGNAAVLHYRPTKEHSDQLPSEGFLLFDVCAHYYEGSTDITRAISLGPLTKVQKEAYTFTLKRHIQLAQQKFIYGTTGPLLDAVVKSHYWNRGLLNPAGTGHGMGYCAYIQEGPCKIATDASPFFHYMYTAAIEPGMIFSNEPGVYDIHSHAVRIENTIVAEDAFANESGRYLGFRTLTYIPLEKDAILVEELTNLEREWIDDYHAETYRRLSPFLNAEEREWLQTATSPLV